jgi:hypothetical protein
VKKNFFFFFLHFFLACLKRTDPLQIRVSASLLARANGVPLYHKNHRKKEHIDDNRFHSYEVHIFLTKEKRREERDFFIKKEIIMVNFGFFFFFYHMVLRVLQL